MPVAAPKKKRAKHTAAPVDTQGGIDYGLAGLGEMLRAFRLRVSKYQRDYAWDEQNVLDLLDDLAGAIEKGERRVNPELGGLVVSDSTADITLEHVLPENRTTDWSAFDDETHASYVNRIGNLCPLAEDDNASLGSGSFAGKKKAYRTSRLKLTNDIASETTWTRKEIEDRSAKLASLAVKTWPLSVDMVKPARSKDAKAVSK